MDVIVIDSVAYKLLKEELFQQFKKTLAEVKNEFLLKSNPENDWITIEEAKKIMPYKSKVKWKELRTSGKIKFTRFGRKIKYSKQSLMNFLNRNVVSL